MPHLIWFEMFEDLDTYEIVQFKCLSGKVNGNILKCLAF